MRAASKKSKAGKKKVQMKDLEAKNPSKIKGGMNKQDLVAEIPKKSGLTKSSA